MRFFYRFLLELLELLDYFLLELLLMLLFYNFLSFHSPAILFSCTEVEFHLPYYD